MSFWADAVAALYFNNFDVAAIIAAHDDLGTFYVISFLSNHFYSMSYHAIMNQPKYGKIAGNIGCHIGLWLGYKLAFFGDSEKKP